MIQSCPTACCWSLEEDLPAALGTAAVAETCWSIVSEPAATSVKLITASSPPRVHPHVVSPVRPTPLPVGCRSSAARLAGGNIALTLAAAPAVCSSDVELSLPLELVAASSGDTTAVLCLGSSTLAMLLLAASEESKRARCNCNLYRQAVALSGPCHFLASWLISSSQRTKILCKMASSMHLERLQGALLHPAQQPLPCLAISRAGHLRPAVPCRQACVVAATEQSARAETATKTGWDPEGLLDTKKQASGNLLSDHAARRAARRQAQQVQLPDTEQLAEGSASPHAAQDVPAGLSRTAPVADSTPTANASEPQPGRLLAGDSALRQELVQVLEQQFWPLNLDMPGTEVLHLDPPILRIPDFLGRKECNTLMELASAGGTSSGSWTS